MNYKRVKRVVISDEVVSQIKNMIVTRELKIGEKLPNERELTNLFGVSRSTVREALRVLELQGLLYRSNAGTFVQAEFTNIIEESLALEILLNSANFEDVQSARVMLESELIDLASKNYTKENLLNLENLITEMEKALGKNDIMAFIEADIAFHNEIALAANNSVLLFLFQAISSLIFKVQKKVVYDEQVLNVSLHYHKMIVQAFQNKEFKKAKAGLIEHLHDVEKRLHHLQGMNKIIWEEIQH